MSHNPPPLLVGDLVSVIVPTYNSGRTLERCLKSIRSQTYSPIEVIVVDNNSTDNTATIAKKLADRLFRQGPERSAQRNAGAALATGKYLLFIDSDMELTHDVVGNCVRTVEDSPAVVWIPEQSFGIGFWAQCKVLERSFYTHDNVTAAARFFSKDLFDRLGGYDENLVAMEDWDLSLRAQALVPLRRADALILHDEGHLRLSRLLLKKYWYGSAVNAFLARHGGEARKRLSPFRASLWTGVPKLVRRPILGAGLVVMKALELVMFVGGSLFPPHDSILGRLYPPSAKIESH